MFNNKRHKYLYIILLIILFVIVFMSTDESDNIISNKSKNSISDTFIENDYFKSEDHEAFIKRYTPSVGEYFDPMTINFDFEMSHFGMNSIGKIIDGWDQYVVMTYSFEDNYYILTYVKENKNVLNYRMYTYEPDKNDKIELVQSDFEEDFYAISDKEKYLLLDDFYKVYKNQINKLGLTVDDLLKWKTTLD